MQRSLRSAAFVEIAAMSTLILSYIWVWQRSFAGAFLLVAAGYFGIGVAGHMRRGESLRSIGVRIDNWLPAVRDAAAVVALFVPLALAAGMLLESWHFPSWSSVALTLPATIVWGTAQQYGLLCVFYRRLHEVFEHPAGAIAGAALLFALFHLPNSFLMAVTLIAGAIACVLYRRQPNVFVIGIAHALISFTLYYALPDTITASLRVGPGYFTRSADGDFAQGDATKGAAPESDRTSPR